LLVRTLPRIAVPEWLKGAGGKSAGECLTLVRIQPPPYHRQRRRGPVRVTNTIRPTKRGKARTALVTCLILLAGCVTLVAGWSSDALWFVVHNACARDQRQFGIPSPCTKVDLAAGYALLKYPGHPTHFLLVPTARVTGIEDPALLSPNAPNYWAQAWHARQYVEERAGRVLAREDLILAVNSIQGRSQDQLHIHIDCIKPKVKAALHTHAAAIGRPWAHFPTPLAGNFYLAKRIDSTDLDGVNPFRLLAALPQARSAMGEQTLAVTGETGPDGLPGFILLAGRAFPDITDGGGEALQDHRCLVGRENPKMAPARVPMPDYLRSER